MSETTNLQLKKHDNVATNTNQFDIENYLNGNWDKIDTAYGTMGTNINAKYTKPVGGIPKTDLASDVQTSLGKADTAIQTHQDISGKEDKSNKVTELTSESTNTQYPSAKLLYDKLAEKQTEIDNLQTDVEDLRNASYKVPGTGTDITLNNTASARLLDIELKGNTSQATLEGRNLLNGTNPTGTNYANATLNNNVLKISSTATNTTPFVRYEFNVTEGEIYRLNAIIKNTNGQIVFQKYSSSWESVAALTRSYIDGTSISSISYTVPSSVTMVRFLIYANNIVPSSASESNYENVIVTKNNADMTYEPYCGGIPSPNPDFPQQIKNVTGNANVKTQNKNLANINEIPSQSGYVSVQIIDDTIKIYNNNNPVGYTPLNIKLKQLCPSLKVGDIVMLSFKTTSNMSNKNAIYLAGADILWNKETAKTITESMLDSMVALYGGNNETAVISEFQIEQGTTATSYVEHQEQNYPFTFAEGQRGMQGTTLEDDGIHNTRKQVVFDGSADEDWKGATSIGNVVRFQCDSISGQPISNIGQLCSHFIYSYSNADNQHFYINPSNGAIFIFIDKNIAKTTNELRNWLSNNPIAFEYYVTEEEIIPYNETQQEQYNAIKQARSYDDITYITSESDELGFDMKVVAVADANKVIDSLDTRLLALESEV